MVFLRTVPSGDLITVSLEGNTDAVARHLLFNPAAAREKGFHGYTALHWAAMDGHTEMVERLLKAGADANAVSKEKVTPLYLAAQRGHAKVVHVLLDSGAKPDLAANYYGPPHTRRWGSNIFDGCTPLYVAAENGHTEVVQLLLAHGASPDKLAKYGSPLTRAVLEKHAAVVEAILKAGADPNAADADGATALMYADSAPLAEMLLQAGANSRVATPSGSTPLYSAAYGRSVRVVELLLSAGADPNSTDSEGEMPLHGVLHICGCCGPEGRLEIVRMLLDKGAAVNAKDKDGQTPLLLAELAGRRQIAELLRSRGGISSGKGSSPIFAAVASGDPKRVAAVLDLSPSMVNARDKENETPLHKAAVDGNLAVVKLLVARGANIFARSNTGYSFAGDRTPLEYSIAGGDLSVMRLLLGEEPDPTRRVQDMIYVAAELGRCRLAQELVSRGANVNKPTKWNQSVLCIAIGSGPTSEGGRKTVDFLLAQGAGIKGQAGANAVRQALTDPTGLPTAKLLLAKGVDLKAAQQTDKSMLSDFASNPGFPEGLEFLLHHGVDARGEDGSRALESAHDPETIHSLMRHGARLQPTAAPGFWQSLLQVIRRITGRSRP